jgi:hypothetical protein
MTVYAQSVYPVPYQWRRVATAIGVAAALNVAARWPHLGLVPSLAAVAVYPLALLVLGFTLPEERARLRRPAARPDVAHAGSDRARGGEREREPA